MRRSSVLQNIVQSTRRSGSGSPEEYRKSMARQSPRLPLSESILPRSEDALKFCKYFFYSACCKCIHSIWVCALIQGLFLGSSTGRQCMVGTSFSVTTTKRLLRCFISLWLMNHLLCSGYMLGN